MVSFNFDTETLLRKRYHQLKFQIFAVPQAIHLEQLCNYLDERELSKQESQREKLAEIQATLEEQVKQPKNNAIDKGGPLDLENCGPSSIQRFQGEDNDRSFRKKFQQQQVSSFLLLKIKIVFTTISYFFYLIS